VLRTPIDTVIGFTKIPLHRSNFSDTKDDMPAVKIACGEISGDALHLQIEKSADKVLSPWVGWFRASNIRVNGELLDPERMYIVAGYWNLDDPDKINRTTALQIKVLRDADGGIVDATHVVAYYLQTLPHKTVNPELNRVRLLKPLPKPIWKNREIQPLRGVPRADYPKPSPKQG
jgi:hypothetical protein